MKTHISYSLIQHKDFSRIAVKFDSNKQFNNRMLKVPGAKWSKSLCCWHILDTPLNRQRCGIAAGKTVATAVINAPQQAKPVTPRQALYNVSPGNKKAMNNFIEQLTLKAYSPSTIRTYRNEFAQLLQTLALYPVETLTVPQLKRYLIYCINNGCSENTIHSRMNAIKFYFEEVLKQSRMFLEIPRPKKPLLLPGVFSKEEVAAIINTVQNLKQKTILMLTYACGLRVSEVVSLKVADIDSKRMSIYIRRAKGKKDRVVSMSATLLVMLREYYRKYHPVTYLFENNRRDEHYSTRSIQMVLQQAKMKAGIIKTGGMHTLRHSFATHLLDKGIDVVMIQKLLGHNNIKTTLRYLHITNKDLHKIISPLEDIKGMIK